MASQDAGHKSSRWRRRKLSTVFRQVAKRSASRPTIPKPSYPFNPTPLVPRSNYVLPLDQNINTQDQSPFGATLPVEVRLFILRQVLSGNYFHIIRHASHNLWGGYRRGRPSKLGFLHCAADDRVSHIHFACWGLNWPDNTYAVRFDKPGNRTDGDILPLLLSCKLIYFEAMSLIYSENIFAFCDSLSLGMFVDVVPHDQLTQIRHLYIGIEPHRHCNFPPEFKGCHRPFFTHAAWLQFWQHVRELAGLKILEVKFIEFPWFWWHIPKMIAKSPEDKLSFLLDPICTVGTLDQIQVTFDKNCQRFVNKNHEILDIKFEDLLEIRYGCAVTPVEWEYDDLLAKLEERQTCSEI